jgi:hypothetical protein
LIVTIDLRVLIDKFKLATVAQPKHTFAEEDLENVLTHAFENF